MRGKGGGRRIARIEETSKKKYKSDHYRKEKMRKGIRREEQTLPSVGGSESKTNGGRWRILEPRKKAGLRGSWDNR